jgi:hypothetical protein
MTGNEVVVWYKVEPFGRMSHVGRLVSYRTSAAD